MIICAEKFSVAKCIECDGNPEEMHKYVLSIIPRIYHHNTALVSNQKYYMNIAILKDDTIPVKKKISISNTLLEGVNVCGYLDSFISIQGIERFVNQEKLIKLRKENA